MALCRDSSSPESYHQASFLSMLCFKFATDACGPGGDPALRQPGPLCTQAAAAHGSCSHASNLVQHLKLPHTPPLSLLGLSLLQMQVPKLIHLIWCKNPDRLRSLFGFLHRQWQVLEAAAKLPDLSEPAETAELNLASDAGAQGSGLDLGQPGRLRAWAAPGLEAAAQPFQPIGIAEVKCAADAGAQGS